MRFFGRCLLVAVLLLRPGELLAGRYGAPVDPDYDQTLTPAISYGVIGARSAEFGGVTVNYGQAFTQRWSWNFALAWDNEKSRNKSGDSKRANTFTGILTGGYAISRKWDISFGFGKGFADDDNNDEQLAFTNGDWSTGTSLGWTFWQRAQRRLSLSTSIEYNLSSSEPSFSLDLGYGFSF